MLCRAGKPAAARLAFPARPTTRRTRQGTPPIAHIAKTLTQGLQVVEPDVIDPGMVTPQDELVLVMAENAALELARYGHGNLQVFRRHMPVRRRRAAMNHRRS